MKHDTPTAHRRSTAPVELTPAPTPSRTGRNVPRDAEAEMPLVLLWGNNNTSAVVGGRTVPFVGWYTDKGRDAQLDEILAGGGYETVKIRHARQGGASEVIEHWNLGEEIKFYPLTSGPVALTIAGCLARYNHESMMMAGIGLQWPHGGTSRMAIRGYLWEAAEAGYPLLMQVNTRSRMTGVLLAALLRHVNACERADAHMGCVVEPVDLAMPFSAAEPEEWGKAATSSVVPFQAHAGAKNSKSYFQSLWRPEIIAQAAERDWAGVQEWAAAFAVEQQG